jgi:hypothetical protein
MPKRSSNDPNVSAFSIVQQATGQTDEEKKPRILSSALDNDELRKELMREMGRRGGKKGGKARANSLSEEQRTKIARAAAKKRWGTKD